MRGEAGCDLHPTSCTARPQKGAEGEGSTSSSSLQALLLGRGMSGLKQPLHPTGCPYPSGIPPKNRDEHPVRARQSSRALAGERGAEPSAMLQPYLPTPNQGVLRGSALPPSSACTAFFSLKKTPNNKPSSQLGPSPEAELQGAAQGREQLPACPRGQSQTPLAARGGDAGAFPPYGRQK